MLMASSVDSSKAVMFLGKYNARVWSGSPGSCLTPKSTMVPQVVAYIIFQDRPLLSECFQGTGQTVLSLHSCHLFSEPRVRSEPWVLRWRERQLPSSCAPGLLLLSWLLLLVHLAGLVSTMLDRAFLSIQRPSSSTCSLCEAVGRMLGRVTRLVLSAHAARM